MVDSSFKQDIAAIREDRTRGASELARRCLAILADAALNIPAQQPAELRRRLQEQAHCLAAVRPSMAPIQNLLQRWCRELENMPVDGLAVARRYAADHALSLSQSSQQAVTMIAGYAADLLGSGKTLMTHSLSSTLLAVCRLLKDHNLHMIITESRPLEEGRRLAATLSAWAVPTIYITDAQMGLFVGQADAVLVGADSVLSDGAVLNKSGTYLLALAARDQGVPFYVCCESFKLREQETAELEEMAVTELQTPPWSGVTRRNIYFEITPARLVSGWINEHGIIRQWAQGFP